MKRDILGRFISSNSKVVKYFKVLVALLFVIGFTNGLISAADLVHDNVQKLKGSMVFASTKPVETQTINVSGMTVDEELQNLIETKTQEEMKSASNLKMYHDMVESEVNKQINILTATFK
jgi:hypothetical protein